MKCYHPKFLQAASCSNNCPEALEKITETVRKQTKYLNSFQWKKCSQSAVRIVEGFEIHEFHQLSETHYYLPPIINTVWELLERKHSTEFFLCFLCQSLPGPGRLRSSDELKLRTCDWLIKLSSRPANRSSLYGFHPGKPEPRREEIQLVSCILPSFWHCFPSRGRKTSKSMSNW